MHDLTDLESRGLVGVMIASDEFRNAHRVQAQALGYDPFCVFIPHPIQDRSDDEMRALAAAAEQEILDSLVATS